EACVLEGGIAAARQIDLPRLASAKGKLPAAAAMSAAELSAKLADRTAQVIDLRPSMTYRKEHVAGAIWSIRPKIAERADQAKTTMLIADAPDLADLATLDLAEAGCRDVHLLSGGHDAARAAGVPMASSPGTPSDAECIDFLFFTAKRHDNDADA